MAIQPTPINQSINQSKIKKVIIKNKRGGKERNLENSTDGQFGDGANNTEFEKK